MALGAEEIENRFGFHKATIEGDDATKPKHADIRAAFKDFAEYLDDVLPDGRYKELMEDDLERASMWSHKAIAATAPLIDE
jgi:hypothetical protein